MMTNRKMLCAQAGATAIAAALALSPTYAKAPKPIVDLSASPALREEASVEPAAKPESTQAKPASGPVDEQMLQFGGGALALLALGAGAFALSRRKKREEAERQEDASAMAAPEPRDPLFDEPMFKDEPAAPSVFAWGNRPRFGQQRTGRRTESWVERAYRGPTPDNPSLSLRTRLKRAAFFDKREREAAAGRAAPVEADAGLPESMTEPVQERQLEAA